MPKRQIYVVVDPGSCHMGNYDYACELLDVAIEAGADFIKWQLGTRSPNHDFQLDWWTKLKAQTKKNNDKPRIGMIASFFTEDALNFLIDQRPLYMKFAYSQNTKIQEMNRCISEGIKPIVSCDVMNHRSIPSQAVKLYCIPEYPVKYKVDFDNLFPPFDGFSDHTLGYNQSVQAIKSGAIWIEKHLTLDKYDIDCPDSCFALKPNELREFTKWIKYRRND